MLPLLSRSAIQEYIGVSLALSQEYGRLGLSAVQNTLLSSTSNCLVTPKGTEIPSCTSIEKKEGGKNKD